ncbi:MAG: tetratricopeptide repeat protein [Phycisphaerales bacterium]|nr:tetratricopeptide repeat protein [Phycisphaerales bacterium]
MKPKERKFAASAPDHRAAHRSVPLPPVSSRRRTSLRHGALIALAACAVYANSLSNGFTYDDVPMVVRNEHLAESVPWWQPWVEPYWPGSNEGDVIDLLYRPLTVQTYGWQRRLLGLDPLSFHAVNVLLHAVVSLMLWRVSLRLGLGDGAALAAAMLFAVHPVHVEAVANIVGRAEILSALGVLGAVLAEDARLRIERESAVRTPGRVAQSPRPFPRTLPYAAWTALMLLFVAVAVFSKETGAAAVIVVTGWRLWSCKRCGTGLQPVECSTGFQPVECSTGLQPVECGTGFQPVECGTGLQPVQCGTGLQPVECGTGFQPVRCGTGFQPVQPPVTNRCHTRPLRSMFLRTLLPALAILGLYMLIRYHVCASRLVVGGQRGGAGNFLRETDAWARLWSPFAVLGHYVSLMAYPARLLCDYSLNVITPVRSPFEPFALLGLGTAAAMATALARSLRRRGVAALVILGFAASYVIPGNVVVYIDVIMAERLFYTPSLWLCILAGMLLAPYLTRDASSASRGETAAPRPGSAPLRVETATPPAARVFRAAFLVACVVLAGRTWLRNPVWSDTRTLMQNDLSEMSPGRRSCHVCVALARDRIREGDLPEAEALVREAAAIYADFPGVHAMMAEVFERQGRYAEAVECWRSALVLAPHNLDFSGRLGDAQRLAAGVNPDEEREAARLRVEAAPEDPQALRRWAQLNESADPKVAEDAYRRLLAIDAADVPAWKALAYVRVALNRRHDAAGAYRQALALAPNDWEAHTNLSVLLIDRTDAALFDPRGAIAHARRAVELNPTHWDLRVNLAEVLAHCGQESEAADLFENLAAQSAPGSPQQRLYHDRAKALRGR